MSNVSINERAAMTEEETRAFKRRQEERAAVSVETNALAIAFNAFQPLGEEARLRAMRWLAQALELPGAYRRTEEPPF